MATLAPLFSYPFRIFFLSAAAWAVLVVLLWVPQINGALSLPLAYPMLLWHRHEILFGLLSPAIAGFLLTAVCVWTQTERLHGWPLLLLWLVWLLGRVGTTVAGADNAGWVSAVNLAFLPLVALDAGRRIIAAKQWRQLIVLLIIALLWLMQAGLLITASPRFTAAALLLTATLMLVVGGRITPAFSANWLRAKGANPARVQIHPGLEAGLLASLTILLACVLLPASIGGARAIAAAAITTALLAFARLYFWRGWLVRKEPLLWILHLSLLWIPIALVLFAGQQLWNWPSVVWQHALGIGAMGGLILGVMARVSLGHTGRPLELPRGLHSAFLLIQLAALARVLAGLAVIPWRWGIVVAALAWTVAFALFLLRYSSVLCAPRADGRPD